MQFHDAANIFPLMGDDELALMANDIATHGLKVPIEKLGEEIIDGRNRYRACLLCDVEPSYIAADIGDESPVDYVISLNLLRRHLTEPQRAMVGARTIEHYAKEAKERQARKPKDSVPVNLPEQTGDARDKAGESVGVSGKSVDSASKVIANGSASLIKAADSGEIAISTAAKLSALPKQEQTEAINGGKDSIKDAVGDKVKCPQYPASDEINRVLTDLAFVLQRARNNYGAFDAMLKHKDWDQSETPHISQMIFGYSITFQKLRKEIEDAINTK